MVDRQDADGAEAIVRVANTVCVRCDQGHGREHLPGCPYVTTAAEDGNSEYYERGWMMAREAYGRLAVEAANRERAKIVGALSEVVALLERAS
jgi:hypothetical protein